MTMFLPLKLIASICLMVSLNLFGMSARASDLTIVDKFPRAWTGVFRWHEVMGDQYITVNLTRVRKDGNRLAVTGSGTYLIGKSRTDMKVEWLIDIESRFIEMWDSDPSGDDTGLVTHGSYKGTISRDFDEIFAIWRTYGTDETGSVRLTVRDPAVSETVPAPGFGPQ